MGNYAEHLRRFSVTRAQLGKKNKEMLNQAADRIEQLEQENQSPQTSLAEVKAKQAEESYIEGYTTGFWDGFSELTKVTKDDVELNAEYEAAGHAQKIRNNNGGQ